MNRSSRLAGEVAEAFLRWPERLELYGVCGRFSLPPSDTLKEGFHEELKKRFPERHSDDLGNVGKLFLDRCPSLWEWYQEVLTAHGIIISFFNARPAVGQEGFSRWAQLVRQIDPDSLITHALVAQGQETAVPRLAGWGMLVPSGDRELERLFERRGLVDTHVHLSGCDPIAGLWQRLVGGRTRAERLRRYKPSRLARFDEAKRLRRRAEAETWQKGIEARERLRAKFMADAAFHEQAPGSDASLASLLLEERRLLAWSWWKMKGGDERIEEELDCYLLGKNIFFRVHHHQKPGIRPGLRTFRVYFDQGEEWVSEESRRIRRDKIERRVLFATECSQLRAIELRIAPFLRLDQYVEFFRTWKALLGRRRRRRNPRITFIVHFIRPTTPEDGKGRLPFETLRRRIDRQTAVLHLFRRNRREFARYITGIDVANLERDCPPEVFSPYLRLLRADCPELLEGGIDPIVNDCWLRLAPRGDACHPVDLPRLYLTYHAGEDFYHPLQGMRDMSAIVDGAGMRAGDRIGHGLAAGWDLAAFEQGRGADLQVPAGVLWDALVWALDHAERRGLGEIRARRYLEDRAAEVAIKIHGNEVPLRVASHLQNLRHKAVPHKESATVSPESKLWYRELFDPECRSARQQLVPFPYSPDLHSLLLAVQEDFVRELAQRRIVIELNPTSNLLVGGVPDLRRHPFFRLRDIAGPALAVTFNTDDPGVFATRIDAEYALMLDAMLANGIPKHECMEILENVLEAAERSLFS